MSRSRLQFERGRLGAGCGGWCRRWSWLQLRCSTNCGLDRTV